MEDKDYTLELLKTQEQLQSQFMTVLEIMNQQGTMIDLLLKRVIDLEKERAN